MLNFGGEEYIIKSAEITGQMLKKSGINLNFAPVLDIKRFEDNHALGDRCYGENKEDVTKYGIEVMKNLQSQGVIPVIKHFPGHGSTKQDSHAFLPVIATKMEKLEKEDISISDLYMGEKNRLNLKEASVLNRFRCKNELQK